jgi:hypothetical protein
MYRQHSGIRVFPVIGVLIYTYPIYYILNKVRKAVRAHQLREDTLGEYIDEFFTKAIVSDAIPMIFLTFVSVAAVQTLKPHPIKACGDLCVSEGKTWEDLDDDEEAAERWEADTIAMSILVADSTMNSTLFYLLFAYICLFGTGAVQSAARQRSPSSSHAATVLTTTPRTSYIPPSPHTTKKGLRTNVNS